MDDAATWFAYARRGDFTRAWEVSDSILRRHIANPDWTRPRHYQSIWKGAPLDDQRVLIRCYHGIGDTIQFIRYAPMVRAIAREVIVWAPTPLIPLLRSVQGIDRLVPLHEGVPDVEYDVDVEVMELAYVFRSTLETIPRDVPYLSAPAMGLPGRAPHIGVVWRAGDWEIRRSIPFDALRPLFDIERVTWLSLQQGRRPSESHPRLVDISDASLAIAASRVRSLDVLITVDSMPAHLAGALAVPVWTLLIKDPDWRWMDSRDDSPWYPTMRLFRQSADGRWTGVVRRIGDAVRVM